MKKSLSLILFLLVGLFIMLGTHLVLAGNDCPAMKASSEAKVTDAKAAGDKASCAKTCTEAKTAGAGGCPMSKLASAKTSGADEAKVTDAKSGGCPMAKTAGEKTAAVDAKCCDHEGKCANLTLNIKGMTCTGCETKITEALKANPGVLKVVSIDYKTGQAVVCYDSAKVESSKLIGLVSGAGYQAEVIPAVAKSGEVKKGLVCDMTGKCTKAKEEAKAESH